MLLDVASGAPYLTVKSTPDGFAK